MKNKKRFSKLAALTLIATMLVGSANVVSAHEVENTSNVELFHAALCDACGYGKMMIEYGPWTYTHLSYPDCIHYPHGNDTMQERHRSVGWRCNYCKEYLYEREEYGIVLIKCNGHY